MMAAVRRRDTAPELAVRRALHAAGLRFRLDVRTLPGRPDVVLRSRRAAIFVNGCFWHRHPGCRHATVPATRVTFWQHKFSRNVVRDRNAASLLRRDGWTVLTVWECQARDPRRLAGLVALLRGIDKAAADKRRYAAVRRSRRLSSSDKR
jgi:DNA mismatch endonuclease, patch repair protein